MTRNRSPVRCIVCDKAITKRLTYMWFREPRPAFKSPFSTHPEKPDGHREGGSIVTIYLNDRPRTKEQAQRHGNTEVIRIKRDQDGYVTEATFWDGESYRDKYFCSDNCARLQGYASAQHGNRYTWRKS